MESCGTIEHTRDEERERVGGAQDLQDQPTGTGMRVRKWQVMDDGFDMSNLMCHIWMRVSA